MKKKLLFLSLLFLPAISHSSPIKYIQLSSATVVTQQPGTTNYWFYVGSGTVKSFNPINLRSTGTWTLTGTTINGTKTDNSTTTFTGFNTFTLSSTTLFNSGATPSEGQIKIKANGAGNLGLFTFAVDNSRIMFDANWNGSNLFANDATAYQILKSGGVLNITGNQNLTPGNSFSATTIATFYPSGELEMLGTNTNTNSANGALYFHSNAGTTNRIIRFAGGVAVDPLIYVPKGLDTMILGATSGVATSTYASFGSAGVSILGTNTNDNATPGNYGEYISTGITTSVNVANTTVYGNIVSTTVQAGDYAFSGVVCESLNGATQTVMEGVISLFSGNTTTDHQTGYNDVPALPPTSATENCASIPLFRVSVNTPTTVYLKEYAAFTGGPPKCRGTLTAIRMR